MKGLKVMGWSGIVWNEMLYEACSFRRRGRLTKVLYEPSSIEPVEQLQKQLPLSFVFREHTDRGIQGNLNSH